MLSFSVKVWCHQHPATFTPVCIWPQCFTLTCWPVPLTRIFQHRLHNYYICIYLVKWWLLEMCYINTLGAEMPGRCSGNRGRCQSKALNPQKGSNKVKYPWIGLGWCICLILYSFCHYNWQLKTILPVWNLGPKRCSLWVCCARLVNVISFQWAEGAWSPKKCNQLNMINK